MITATQKKREQTQPMTIRRVEEKRVDDLNTRAGSKVRNLPKNYLFGRKKNKY